MAIIIWLSAFLLIIPPVFFPDLGVWMLPDFLNKQWVKIVVLFPIGFCLMWIWFKTGYTIENNSIKIQYGPFKKYIEIDEIYNIRETKNPFTAPALSMNRVEINYGKYETIQISPKEISLFVGELQKKNPHIQIKNY
ncbi:PH domain-containing protein [Virgibacillus sp. JSM 102003]|uniref:PH domain-containing protein n=1 Tax=Virgibacillus sp. JSM 102003 TaxID=1562108 RepID=UPI0035C267E0